MSSRPRNVGTGGKKLDFSVLKRLMSYIFEKYKTLYIIVFIGIIISSLAQVGSSLFMKSLIDDYITPLIVATNKDFGPLFNALLMMAGIYLIGIIANFVYQKLLVIISQGTMERIRTDMFAHMQSLPIGYFDSNAHGDIMSLYTNDTDTLRQVISQSIPQFISSLFTIISVLISMFIMSVPLTLVTLSMVVVMQFVLRFIMGKSGKYFAEQQK